MSFFRSLFRRKPAFNPADPGVIKATLDDISSFCNDVTQHVGVSVFVEDAMERQVLSVYAFGGIHVLCQQKGLNPPDGHALAIALLHKYFGYSNEDSVAKAQALIKASSERTSSLNAIIHRGIDGFLAWQAQRSEFDASDFKGVMATLRAHPTA